jgi:hypothetical protein
MAQRDKDDLGEKEPASCRKLIAARYGGECRLRGTERGIIV